MNYYNQPPDKYDSSQPTYISTPDMPPTYFNSQSGVPQHYYQQGVAMPQAASSLQSLAAAQQLALYAQNVQQVGYNQAEAAQYAHAHAHASAAHNLSAMSSMYSPGSNMHQGSAYHATAANPTSHAYMQASVQQLPQYTSARVPQSTPGMFPFRGVDAAYSHAPAILRPTATPAAGYYSVNGQVVPVSAAYPSGQHYYTG